METITVDNFIEKLKEFLRGQDYENIEISQLKSVVTGLLRDCIKGRVSANSFYFEFHSRCLYDNLVPHLAAEMVIYGRLHPDLKIN